MSRKIQRRIREEKERQREILSRSNLEYAYGCLKKYQGPGGYEASIKNIVKDLRI